MIRVQYFSERYDTVIKGHPKEDINRIGLWCNESKMVVSLNETKQNASV